MKVLYQYSFEVRTKYFQQIYDLKHHMYQDLSKDLHFAYFCYQENNFNTQWVTGDWGPGFKVDLTLPKIYCVILHIIFFD